MYFDFATCLGVHRRSTSGAEVTSAIVLCLAFDYYGILTEYCSGVKQSTVMLTTIKAMANSNTVGYTFRFNSGFAALASAGNFFHSQSPRKDSFVGEV